MNPSLPLTRFAFAIVLIFFLFVGKTSGYTESHPPTDADTLTEARRLYQEAMKAYEVKQYAVCAEHFRQVLRLRPNYPLATYNLAAVYALAGNQAEAIHYLNKLADLGMYADAATDEDFKSIKEKAAFRNALDRLTNNKKPVGHSKQVFSLSEKDLITEGIAYWPTAKTFYVSSVHKRKIVAVNASQQVSDFSNPQDSLWSVQSLAVDTVGRFLWASSTAYPQMEGFKPIDEGRTGVFKYDLQTGKLAKRYLADDKLAKGLGDIVLSPAGDVFAADQSGAIYRTTSTGHDLRVWLPAGKLYGPQGMAFSVDGWYLFVADYPTGIARVDMRTREVITLPTPANTCLMGVDGLYVYGNDLIAIQNGTTPHRLLRLNLNSTLSAISRVTVLEANHPLWNEPTLGVRLNDEFYYIANSQWGSFNPDGSLPKDKLQPPTVLKIRLK